MVYGLLRTSDALSKVVTANQVLFSLILFFLVYALLLVLFLYLLNKKIVAGPGAHHDISHSPVQRDMAEAFPKPKS